MDFFQWQIKETGAYEGIVLVSLIVAIVYFRFFFSLLYLYRRFSNSRTLFRITFEEG